MIQGLGLEQYYKLRETLDSADGTPATPGAVSYQFFADPVFQQRYVKQLSEERAKVNFYLKDMHCAACVWLLERLPEVCPGVIEARAHYGRSRIHITFDPSQVALASIAETLDALGYPPRPLSSGQHEGAKRRERKRSLLRLAVAGMCAGNTMMFAVSLYQGWFTGIATEYERFLSAVSMLLALPAVLYSAVPFYRAAYSGLRVRMLHIDLPITIGIVLGFLASVFNTLRGEGHVYYDSITALIFLLLLGRWLQRASVDKVLERAELLYSLAPRSARRRKAGNVEEIYSGSIRPGDILLIGVGEIACADGCILEGESAFDRSVLTGESRAVPARVGDRVFAGTKNLEQEVALEVEKADADSRLGSLLSELEASAERKAPLVEMTDAIAGYFVATVLILAMFTALYWYFNAGFEMAFETTLALLVVSCPCALGLAAPISFSIALSSAAKRGIFIKEAAVFERLARIAHVCFDKTGTLTYGEPMIVEYKIQQAVTLSYEQLIDRVVQLEGGQVHPVAETFRAERERLSDLGMQSKSLFVETKMALGRGVFGETKGGEHWFFGSSKWAAAEKVSIDPALDSAIASYKSRQLSPVVLVRNDTAIAVFGLGDRLRDEAPSVVLSLQEQQREVSIISGDHPEIVNALAKTIGIKDSFVCGGLEPEEKAEKLEQFIQVSPTMMVGDGVNDAAAIALADVGVAVRGGAEASLRSADVFFSETDLSGVLRVLAGGRKTLAVVKRNLILSLIYNISGATLAIAGLVSPLLAAVLMPLSSLTVVLSSLSLAGRSFEKTK